MVIGNLLVLTRVGGGWARAILGKSGVSVDWAKLGYSSH